MKKIDHPVALSLVCVVSALGTIGSVLLVIQGVAEGRDFRWAVAAFGLYWGWAAFSSGKRLFRKKEPIQAAETTREK